MPKTVNMDIKVHEFTAQGQDIGKRLDVCLNEMLKEYSRSFIQRLVKEGNILVNGKNVKPNYRIRENDTIKIIIPPPENISVEPQKIELDIIYEDNDIAVINKPQGMVVHPAPGNYTGTLVNALLYHCDNLSGINGKIRPGIVHRIDKDTSGLLVIAKNDLAHRNLAKQIQDKTAFRVYWAIVERNIKQDKGTINAPIARHPVDRKKMAVVYAPSSREAITHYKVLERFGDYTLVEAKLETGRTHQIRVHMAHIGHPIVGDPVYGSRKQKFNLNGQALHAIKLGLIHPSTNEYMEFTAPLPEYFKNLLEILRKIKILKTSLTYFSFHCIIYKNSI